MQPVQPQKEHQWLQQLVGDWAFECEMLMGPGQPTMKTQGTETVRPIGGLWIQCESKGQAPDGTHTTSFITLGYDPAKKRFVGTFVASMMPMLWVYDGSLDDAGKVLALDADGPSFTDPNKTAKYRDSIEIVSADHHLFFAQVLGEDGQWHRFMTSHYRRVK